MKKPELVERCREFRKNPTEAENTLWQAIRGRQIAGLKFRRQHLFWGFIFDFYCPEIKLVIEVDGNVHQNEDQRERDNLRTEIIKDHGIRIIRFRNSDVTGHLDETLQQIRLISEQRKIP